MDGEIVYNQASVDGALTNYGNKVDFQKSSVIAFSGANPNSDINYEIGSVISFINNQGGDIPALAWYEGKYGECNGQSINGLQNTTEVIKAGSVFYAQLVKNDLIYYFDVVTDKIVNQIATKSDLNSYTRKYTPNFATWNTDGYGNVHCAIDLSSYNKMGYILNISIGGNANKSYPLTFAHAVNIYGEDDIIELLKSSTILNDFTFDNSILSLNLSGAYEGHIGIMAI